MDRFSSSNVPQKIVLKSTTKISLNDRFTSIARFKPQTTNMDNVRKKIADTRMASAKNRRLALQMANRPNLVQTAMKLKQRSIKQRLGSVQSRLSTPGQSGRGRGGRGRGNRGGNRGGGIAARLGSPQGNFNTNFAPRRGTRGRGFRGAGRSNFRGAVSQGRGRGMSRGRGGFRGGASPKPFRGNSGNRGNRGGSRGGGRGQRGQSQRGFKGRGRGGRRGRGGTSRGNFEPPSKEDLDDQLDAYMAKSVSQLDTELDAYMQLAD